MRPTALDIDNCEKTFIIKRLNKSMSGSVERAASLFIVVHWGLPSQSRPGYSGRNAITGCREDEPVYRNSFAGRFVVYLYLIGLDHRFSDGVKLHTFGKRC